MQIPKVLILLTLVALTLSGARRSEGLPAPSAQRLDEPTVLTLLDYFESGRQAVDHFVQAGQDAPRSRLGAVIERSIRASVRVEVRSNIDEDHYQSATASGVLIDAGRRVLTAGHVVEGSAGANVLVRLVSGETLPARVLDSQYEVYGGADCDWAILEVLSPPKTPVPSIESGSARTGETVFVLGYPDQIGVDAAGRVTFDAGVEDRYLEPLVTLGVVEGHDPLRISPLAGSVPTSGMSGAPVFDSSGRLIGVFVSIRKATKASSVAYTYSASAVRPVHTRASSHLATP